MSFFVDQHFWSIAAVSTSVLTALCMVADRKRNRRTNLERVGFMPWTGLSIMGTLATLLSVALAIKSG